MTLLSVALPTLKVFPGSFIIGGTQLNISGTLTYSDYNPLASQDVVIRIYDENGQVGPDILRTTSALGGFLRRKLSR